MNTGVQDTVAGATDVRLLSCDALVGRMATGDERAFEEVFDRLAMRAIALVHLCGVNDARCDEIVSAAFLEVWRRSPRVDLSHGGSAAWILAVVCRTTAGALDDREAPVVRPASVTR